MSLCSYTQSPSTNKDTSKSMLISVYYKNDAKSSNLGIEYHAKRID